MIAEVDAACPACGNPVSVHEEGGHPPRFDMPDACFICAKSDPSDLPSNIVEVEGEREGICSACWEALP
jgi:hypothetical protein